MLISGGKYRSEIDCFKLHKENKQKKSASAVEAKFTVFEYEKVKDTSQRQKIVATKKHCYNCLGEEYRATVCKNKKSCKNCNVRYHTLICEKGNRKSTPTLTTQDKQVIHPMVILKVSEIKCRALLDTGAGSAYPSATLIENINKRLSRTEYRKVEMMVPYQ